MSNIETKIITVKDLLQTDLKIPSYQRPYKWTVKNVHQLIDDIIFHNDKSAYRLGTLVVHYDEEKKAFNIVDGQQRTITFYLIAKVLSEKQNYDKVEINKIVKCFDTFEIPDNDITKLNIFHNFHDIKIRLNNIDTKFIDFFFDKCEVVMVTLKDVSEAFQFFDSQNSRGKDLYPHDLLKAFHLREMQNIDENRTKEIIENWESHEQEKLNEIFESYLFRIRNWIKGNSAMKFTKNNVGLFKGINSKNKYPYAEIYKMADAFYENYTNSPERFYDNYLSSFPFKIDQPIVNGKRFFDLINQYIKRIDSLKLLNGDNISNKTKIYKKMNLRYEEYKENSVSDITTRKIIETLAEYEQNNRTGDTYVRYLFECALIYYIDKFGYVEMSRAVLQFFLWAYSLRLRQFSVFLKSVDKYALGNHDLQNFNLFKHLHEAVTPFEALNFKIPIMEKKHIKSEIDKIEDLFNKAGLIIIKEKDNA